QFGGKPTASFVPQARRDARAMLQAKAAELEKQLQQEYVAMEAQTKSRLAPIIADLNKFNDAHDKTFEGLNHERPATPNNRQRHDVANPSEMFAPKESLFSMV